MQSVPGTHGSRAAKPDIGAKAKATRTTGNRAGITGDPSRVEQLLEEAIIWLKINAYLTSGSQASLLDYAASIRKQAGE